MRKPFSCSIDGRDVTVTEVDAAIMMEESAVEEIGKILVSNKRANNNNADEQAPKRRRKNAACNTTRGATGFDALHGAKTRKLIISDIIPCQYSVMEAVLLKFDILNLSRYQLQK